MANGIRLHGVDMSYRILHLHVKAGKREIFWIKTLHFFGSAAIVDGTDIMDL